MTTLPFRRALLLGALMLLAACGEQAALAPDPARPVLTMLLGAAADAGRATYSGEVRSRYETALAFRIPGKIVARLVDAGAQVKAGDVLARLDPADTVLSATAASAQLELADADLRRYRELRARNFVSQSALDAKETAFKATRAQAELARNQSSYTVLRAEHAGVIALVAAEVGQVVAAGQMVMRVARSDALEVALAIPETRITEMHLQQAAQVSLWADDEVVYPGVLRELSSVADAATRTYAARVSIAQPDARVLLGMTAKVSFVEEKSGAPDSRLSVPLTALFQQDGKPALWIVGADQAVSLRPVVVAAFAETTAVLASGAQAGERVVVAGVHKLSAGEKIKAVDTAAGAAQ